MDFSPILTILSSAGSTSGLSVFSMMAEAGLMVKFVLFLLFGFSVTSWTIIVYKGLQVRKAGRQSYYFLETFWKSRSMQKTYADSDKFEGSPVAEVFRVGHQEMTRLKKTTARPDESDTNLMAAQGMENVSRALRRTINVENTRLSRTVSFLATTGNTAPFIGLFGTVWGIMSSFQEIGATGSANLAVVAPGISEALVATAAGLATAIPAVIAYNFFLGRIKVLETEMTNFANDFLNILERSTMKKPKAKL